MSYDEGGKESEFGGDNVFKMPDGNIEWLQPVSPDDQAAKLESLSISSDSIVVTVTMTPAPEHRFAQINWGEGFIETVDFQLPFLQPGAPEGSFTVQHEYHRNASTRKYPNFVFVVIAIYDNQGNRTFEAQGVQLRPRFRCVIYPVRIKASHHDTKAEENSEFRIHLQYQQGENVLLDREWEHDLKTFDIDFPSTQVIIAEMYLEGSQFATEMTFADEPIWLSANYVDQDGKHGKIRGAIKEAVKISALGPLGGILTLASSDDSDAPTDQREIHPNENGDGPFEFAIELGSGSTYMEFHFSGTIDVIVPLDRGPIATLGDST